jgi:hypothetical protein
MGAQNNLAIKFRVRFQVLNQLTRKYFKSEAIVGSVDECRQRYDLTDEDYEILSVDQVYA